VSTGMTSSRSSTNERHHRSTMFFFSWHPMGPKSKEVPNDPYTPEPSSRMARDLQNAVSSSIVKRTSPGCRTGSRPPNPEREEAHRRAPPSTPRMERVALPS
jgi:hypothetical protein